MKAFEVNSIGKISVSEEGIFIKVHSKYISALKSLDEFSHINVLWWFSDFDNEEARNVFETSKPYKDSPKTMGIFATRSPIRPNPIALSVAQVINIDYKKGIIQIAYIDANNDSPVLDIKPYTPSIDRVEFPNVPKWCGHWPKSLEESANFDWENEFNF